MGEEKKSLKSQVLSGLVWKFGERFLVQLITFSVSVVLARMLAPDDFGVIAMASVFIVLANTIIASGFGNALVQKEHADELDFSSTFYFCIGFSLVLYALLFVSAPVIARFYHNPIFTPVLRVLGLWLVISGFNAVQYAYIQRHMLFRRFFFSTLGGTVISAVIAFVMALAGFGVWALVQQSVTNCLIDTLILWFTVKWRPQRMFSWQRMKTLFSFGWKLLAASLVDAICEELRALIIGRVYSPADLAYYSKGRSFPMLFTNNLNATIDSVLFPAASKSQSNLARLREITRRSIKTSSYVIMPLMFGLAAVATPLVRFLLTDKWLPCVPYLQVLCWGQALMPVQSANLQALKARGRSDLVLKLSIVKRVFAIVVLLLAVPYGVFAIAASTIITTTGFSIINAQANASELGYGYFAQMSDILPYVLLSAVMAVCLYPIRLLALPDLASLLLQFGAGCAIYLMLSALFRLDSLRFILATLKDMLHSVHAR